EQDDAGGALDHQLAERRDHLLALPDLVVGGAEHLAEQRRRAVVGELSVDARERAERAVLEATSAARHGEAASTRPALGELEQASLAVAAGPRQQQGRPALARGHEV